MESATSHWPPAEGDSVRVKDVGLVGTVIKTKGVQEARFRIQVLATTTTGDAVALKRAKAAARLASRWYSLNELEAVS